MNELPNTEYTSWIHMLGSPGKFLEIARGSRSKNDFVMICEKVVLGGMNDAAEEQFGVIVSFSVKMDPLTELEQFIFGELESTCERQAMMIQYLPKWFKNEDEYREKILNRIDANSILREISIALSACNVVATQLKQFHSYYGCVTLNGDKECDGGCDGDCPILKNSDLETLLSDWMSETMEIGAYNIANKRLKTSRTHRVIIKRFKKLMGQ